MTSTSIKYQANSKQARIITSDCTSVATTRLFVDDGAKCQFRIHLDFATNRYSFELLPCNLTEDSDLTVVFQFWLSKHCKPCYGNTCLCFDCKHHSNYMTVNSADLDGQWKWYEHPFSTNGNGEIPRDVWVYYAIISAQLTTPSLLAVKYQVRNRALFAGACRSAETFQIHASNATFPVTKSLLSAYSDVFKTMFESNYKEAADNTLTINDFDEETVRSMVGFIESAGEITATKCTEQLLLLADKYNIKLLVDRCVDELCRSVTPENFIKRIIFAFKFGNETMKKTLLELPRKYKAYRMLLKSDEYQRAIGKDNITAAICMAVL